MVTLNLKTPSKVDAKASTKQGDIRFKYDSKPEDTILKLNRVMGDSVVKNKTFTNGKVGKRQCFRILYD